MLGRAIIIKVVQSKRTVWAGIYFKIGVFIDVDEAFQAVIFPQKILMTAVMRIKNRPVVGRFCADVIA